MFTGIADLLFLLLQTLPFVSAHFLIPYSFQVLDRGSFLQPCSSQNALGSAVPQGVSESPVVDCAFMFLLPKTQAVSGDQIQDD